MMKIDDKNLNYDVILSTPFIGLNDKMCLRDVPPISLLYVSAILSERKKKVKIIDFSKVNRSENSLTAALLNYRPKIWGITCDVTDRFKAFETAQTIKKSSPDTLVVLGGIFATQCYETIMEDIPSIDLVVRGEGDYAISEIFECFENKDFSDIKGISWRKAGKIIHNEFRPMIKDLNTLPQPDFSLIDFSEYKGEFRKYNVSESKFPVKYRDLPIAHLIFSRGCPFHCIFCTSPGQGFLKYRILEPQKAVQQIEYFYEQGFRNFIFWDDHLLFRKSWFNEFYNLIKSKQLKIYFKISSRVDAITDEKVAMLKELGCLKLTLGLEYGESQMLNFIGKKVTTEQIETVVKLLHKNEIITGGGMLINFPRETFSSVKHSFTFFKDLQQYGFSKNLFPSPVQVHPGTVLDSEYWKKKYPDFRWSKPYFNKRNLFLNADPYVPLWENVPSEKVLQYIIIASMMNVSVTTIVNIIRNLFFNSDSIHLNFLDRTYLRLIIVKSLIIGTIKNPIFVLDSIWQVSNVVFSRLRKRETGKQLS